MLQNTPNQQPTSQPKRKPAMSIDKLLEAVRNTVITDLDVARLNERLAAAEKRFAEEARNKMVTEDFLNREYTI